jgi:U3 small nucleolar ribonucleoprotein protein IMP4
MILLTTSHRPTRRVRSLCNDLNRSIPGLIRVNRGKMSLLDVAERAAQFNAEKFIIVDRWKGGPGRIRLFKITDEGFREEPPRLYISGVKLRREFKASILEKNFNALFIEMHENANPDIEKLKLNLSEFLEVPILKLGSETLNYEAYMRITSGEDCWAYISFFLLPGKIEVGPRIKISHVVWDV